MIRFGDITKLNKILAQVAITSSVGEELSANRCVLIEQLNFSTTQFTSVEPRRAVFKRLYHHLGVENSGGDEGDKFLIDYKSLKERLTTMRSAQVKSLTFQLTKGLLRCRADLAQVNGQRREKGNLLLRQYPGAIEDLYSTPDAKTLIAQVPAESFSTLIFLLNNFGDFTGEKFEGTHSFHRPVLISFSDSNQVEGLTNYKSAYGSYLSIKQPAQVNNPASFSIEGRLLIRLAELSKEAQVNVYLENNWVTFEGDSGVVTLLTMNTPMQLLRESKLLSHYKQSSTVSTRGCNIQDLYSALVMHSSDPSGRSDLLTLEEQAQLVIAPAHNITSKEYSCVAIDPVYAIGQYQPVVFSGLGAEAIASALKKFLIRQRLPTNQIIITQVAFTRPSGAVTWLIYFSIYPLNNAQPNELDLQTMNWVQGLIIARGADNQIDSLLAED